MTKVHYSILVFIITILLLAADFYYLKNIAGRRLVGLRWWNEVNRQDGSSNTTHWVFESSDPNERTINATDSRFFWMALYLQPLLWVALAIVAVVRLEFIWLSLVGTFYLFPLVLSPSSFQYLSVLSLGIVLSLGMKPSNKHAQIFFSTPLIDTFQINLLGSCSCE